MCQIYYIPLSLTLTFQGVPKEESEKYLLEKYYTYDFTSLPRKVVQDVYWNAESNFGHFLEKNIV